MNFYFDTNLAIPYKSNSQKVRIMSESWVGENIFCPACGNPHIKSLKNNSPVADFQCDFCGEIFELKSKNGQLGNKIADGAYSTMLQRITSLTNPNLFVMCYSDKFQVVSLTAIPKFFFTPSIIEKRRPLSPNAVRAGWVGCNILYGKIPTQGKISLLKDQTLRDANAVVKEYRRISQLQTHSITERGWLFDVLNCINAIPCEEFSLSDVYVFSDILQEKHPTNHNVKPKIRQQLQVLRDKGFIEFLGNGSYRKLYDI